MGIENKCGPCQECVQGATIQKDNFMAAVMQGLCTLINQGGGEGGFTDVEINPMCDTNEDVSTGFFRVYTRAADGTVTITDLAADLTTPYIPTGDVTIGGACGSGGVSGDVTVINGAGAAAVNIQDGGNSITVDAVNLDIRDLSSVSDSVSAVQSGAWAVGVTGPVTIAGDIANITTSVTPGTAAGNLGKAEDAVSGAGDTGVGCLAVRSDTAASTAANGDYEFIKLDALGKVWTADCQTEDLAHTTGDRGSYVLAVRADTAAASGANNDYVSFIVDSVGKLWITGSQLGNGPSTGGTGDGDKGLFSMFIVQTNPAATAFADGDFSGAYVDAKQKLWTASCQTEDAVHATGDRGSYTLGVRADTAAASGANGDYVSLIMDAVGKVWTADCQVEDAAHTTGDRGSYVLAVRSDTAAASGANGDYVSFTTDALGKVWCADNQVEDAAAGDGDRGSAILSVRQDTISSSSTTDGDYQFIKSNSLGGVYITGLQAHDAVINAANNPQIIGGVARNGSPTQVAEDDVVRATYDRQGRQVVLPYGPPNSLLSAFIDPTGTSPEQIIAAPGANIATFITSITAANYNAAADALEIETGGGTILWACRNGPSVTVSASFPSTIPVPANTAVNVDAGNAGDWYVTITYFQAYVS